MKKSNIEEIDDVQEINELASFMEYLRSSGYTADDIRQLIRRRPDFRMIDGRNKVWNLMDERAKGVD